jgi:rSAM/selenodomain-associated transferase 1
MHRNKLGIFVRTPLAGAVKTRLVPPLSPAAARDLYVAFLRDLFERVHQAKVLPTVFYSGEPTDELRALVPPRWPLVAQRGADLGARMAAAFDDLLAAGGSRAVLIGSDSPDLPLAHLRHAFQRLKNRDVVLGPAMDGGYYLIGLRARAPRLFEGIAWGEAGVFADTVERIQREQLSFSLLPLWYDVDDPASIALLRALCAARRASGGLRLPHTEAALGPGSRA